MYFCKTNAPAIRYRPEHLRKKLLLQNKRLAVTLLDLSRDEIRCAAGSFTDDRENAQSVR